MRLVQEAARIAMNRSGAAFAIGLVVFYLLRALIPSFYFESLPALNFLILFAAAFLAAAIALRLGLFCNGKFDGDLSARKVVLILGGFIVFLTLFTTPRRDRVPDISIIVQIIGAAGPLLATLLIWLQRGRSEPADA
jgi:hypothetical protein